MQEKNKFFLLVKGVKEIQKISPTLLINCIFIALFHAVQPFFNIYMSAQIINKLTKCFELLDVLIFAIEVVITNFVIELLLHALSHRIAIRKKEFNARYHMRISEKMTRIKYANLEDSETHRLKQEIVETANLTGGIIDLPSHIQNFLSSLFDIIFSISLTITLFATPVLNDTTFTLLITSPWVSVIVLIVILLNVFLGMISNTVFVRKMQIAFKSAVKFNRVYEYYIGNYLCDYQNGKDIRIYNQESVIKSEYNSLLRQVKNLIQKIFLDHLFLSTLTTVTSVILSTITYLYIGLKALFGVFEVGNIVQYISSITRFSNGLSGVALQLSNFRENSFALQIYFKFMDLPEEKITNTENTVPTKIHSIEFENVSFSYPGTNKNVLNKINLKLEEGQKIAIVGSNGSGKTTMIKLLCRLYAPTEGKIKINGLDISEFNDGKYKDFYSVVFQDYKLFSFELGQNVAANAEYNPKKVIQLLEAVEFDTRLMEMRDGLDTFLNKDFASEGVELSGGEAQKVALARALYKDAPLIILDEPTAALDPVSEYEIYSSFNRIVQNRTAIFISHRLSACRFCDKIIVLDDGYVVQFGSHNELVNDKKGKYFKLWDAQAQYYT